MIPAPWQGSNTGTRIKRTEDKETRKRKSSLNGDSEWFGFGQKPRHLNPRNVLRTPPAALPIIRVILVLAISVGVRINDGAVDR